MPGSERKREIRRRRKRKESVTKIKSRIAKATKSEKVEIVRKLREMTPGAEHLISQLSLAEADR